MSVVWTVLGAVLLLFELFLVARVVLDWVTVLSTGSTPERLAPVRRVVHGVTEPVLAPVRRVIRPVRTGSMAIDLALPVVFVVVLILRALIP
jgi:YggT family protein